VNSSLPNAHARVAIALGWALALALGGGIGFCAAEALDIPAHQPAGAPEPAGDLGRVRRQSKLRVLDAHRRPVSGFRTARTPGASSLSRKHTATPRNCSSSAWNLNTGASASTDDSPATKSCRRPGSTASSICGNLPATSSPTIRGRPGRGPWRGLRQGLHALPPGRRA